MQAKDQYKRLVKIFFSAVTVLGLCILYGITWIGYYNRHVLQLPFYRKGNWVMVLLYAVLLAFFLHTYGGFKIGYLKNGNLIYSQILSVFFVNVFTYFQIAVIDKRFVNPGYMVLMTLADVVFILIWTLVFLTVYKNIFPPRKMFFIEGDQEDYHLRDKMSSREDKYEICEVLSYHAGYEYLRERMQL